MASPKDISRICRIFGALLFSLLICFGANISSASETYIPFQPGEKFIFKLRWGVVPAGEASLEVKELANIKGVDAGTFDTLLLEPDLQRVDGVFAKKARARILIWVTDDNRKLPVKLKSKAKVGSFVAELSSIEGVDEMFAESVLQ